jgi:hypothetical protein
MLYFTLDVLDYIKRKYMPMRVESCGFIHATPYGAIIQIMAEGNLKSARPSCTLPYYSDYIWHTHVNGSKSYPSAEDILKVLKRRKKPLKAQLIFSEWGIWETSATVFREFNDIGKEIKAIEKISEDLYNRTERGRAKNVNPEAIEKFMKSLVSRYAGLRIFFTPWHKIVDIYVCKTIT